MTAYHRGNHWQFVCAALDQGSGPTWGSNPQDSSSSIDVSLWY